MIECSICLENIYKYNLFCNKKLTCKHVFHKKCIKEAFKVKRNCPLCNKHIINKNLIKLKKTHDNKIENLLVKLTVQEKEDLCIELLNESKIKNENLLNKLFFEDINLQKILNKYLVEKNIRNIKILLETRLLNFHSSYNGKTIFDQVLETGNRNIINLFFLTPMLPRL